MPLSAPASGVAANYVRVVNQQPYLTPSISWVRQIWTQRALNVITDDDQGLASLAANVLTLQPGSYRFNCYVPLNNTSYHQARLIDTTNAITYLGRTASNSVSSNENSVINGRFVIATPANFIIESFSWLNGINGGAGASFNDDELYTVCEFYEVQA
jgi:hypothetical protein